MILSKRNMIFIAVTVLLAGLLFGYYRYFYKDPVYWGEHFRDDRKDPYGTSMLFQLLEGISNEKSSISVKTNLSRFLSRQDSSVHANYVFVGQTLHLSDSDASSLLHFVEKGNDAFISADHLPYHLSKHLFDLAEQTEDTAAVLEEATAPEEEMTVSPVDTTVITSLQSDTTPYISEHTEPQQASSDSELTVSVQDTTQMNWDTIPTSFEPTYVDVEKNFEDSVISFSFIHPALGPQKKYSFRYLSDFKNVKRSWYYINDSSSADSGITKIILGYLQPDKPVFYRFKVGKGYLYYHTLPLTLTNLYLSRPSTLEYANLLFGHLQQGPVYWDKFHDMYQDEQNNGTPKSPLSYLFSQPSLAWAWYIGLAGILLYLLFFTKRRQRIIPLVPPHVNTSVEFVQTLALFFQKASYGKIAELKARNLRMFIWDRYKISPDQDQEDYIRKVALYSGLEKEMLQRLFGLFRYFSNAATNRKELIEFQKMIEYFYNNCK